MIGLCLDMHIFFHRRVVPKKQYFIPLKSESAKGQRGFDKVDMVFCNFHPLIDKLTQ